MTRTPEQILKEIRQWEDIIAQVQLKIQNNPTKASRVDLLQEHQDRIQRLRQELHQLECHAVSPLPVQSIPHQEPHPLRQEQLEILVTILAGVYQKGTRILDLGIGAGMVESLLFNTIPTAHVVGIDSSQEQLAAAAQRLSKYTCELIQADLTAMKIFQIPPGDYSAALSVQTLHLLPHPAKRRLFGLVYQLLNPQGVFLILNEVTVADEALYPYYGLLRQRQGNSHNTFPSTEGYHLTLEQLLLELKETGFQATCLHLYGEQALVVAHRGT